jgi:hypothetical protein|tara:strand:+ start:2453 stop:2653 length:201 start_codon:yes stop_codon:yes gene_type:complete
MPNISSEGRTILHRASVPVHNRFPTTSEGSNGEQRFVKAPGTEARIYIKMVGTWWYIAMKGALHQS